MASLARCQNSMLRTALRRQVASSSTLSPLITSRYNSTVATPSTSSSTGTIDPMTEAAAGPSSASLSKRAQELAEEHGVVPVRYSYFVPRVGRIGDSLPVYTDVRNGGSRIMTEIRRVEGNLKDLQRDLSEWLEESYSKETMSFAAAEAKREAALATATQAALEPHIPYTPHNGRTPRRIKLVHKVVATRGHPSALEPVQTSVVIESGKLKVRGNRVRQVKEFLESRGF